MYNLFKFNFFKNTILKNLQIWTFLRKWVTFLKNEPLFRPFFGPFSIFLSLFIIFRPLFRSLFIVRTFFKHRIRTSCSKARSKWSKSWPNFCSKFCLILLPRLWPSSNRKNENKRYAIAPFDNVNIITSANKPLSGKITDWGINWARSC